MIINHNNQGFIQQRDTVQGITNFAKRNQLPPRMHKQIVDHLRLKYRTESLKHEEIVPDLPKAIRSAIAHHLFLPIVENVYLFKKTSHDFLLQIVCLQVFINNTTNYICAHYLMEILIECFLCDAKSDSIHYFRLQR